MLQRATTAYQFFERANKIRKEHPGAGCRTMAKELKCKGWGRDKIEGLLLGNGYRLYYPVNYSRTTYAQTDVYYPNLIEGLELTAINQVVKKILPFTKKVGGFNTLYF